MIEIDFVKIDEQGKRFRVATLSVPDSLFENAAEPEPPTDTTPAADEAQEAASAPTEAPAPEITGSGQEAPPERATLTQRLRFLFRGKI